MAVFNTIGHQKVHHHKELVLAGRPCWTCKNFQTKSSKVRVVQTNLSSIRVAGTRWTLSRTVSAKISFDSQEKDKRNNVHVRNVVRVLLESWKGNPE